MKRGKTIRELREKEGITQADLARKLKISPVYLNNIEKGRKNPSEKAFIFALKSMGYELIQSVSKIIR